MKTLLERYDTTFSKLHGGGNGRRLVEIFRDNILGQEQYDKRLVELTKELQKERKGLMLSPEPKSIRFLSKLDFLVGYIMALDEAE